MSKKVYKSFYKASSIVIMGAAVTNVMNYLYNVAMGRMLYKADYGHLISLLSLLLLVSVPSYAASKVVAKWLASFYSQKNKELANYFLKSSLKYLLSLLLFGFISFILLIPFLSDFLKIPQISLIIFSLIIPSTILFVIVDEGFLAGRQNFKVTATIEVIMSVSKFLLGLLLVYFGFKLNGSLIAVFVGFIFGGIVGLLSLRKTLRKVFRVKLKGKASKVMPWKSIKKFALQTFWVILLLNVFTDVDMILAKHYFSRDLAGEYAALVTVGKIILYGPTAIIFVMYSKVAAAYGEKKFKEARKIYFISLLLVAVTGLLIEVIFLLFPNQIFNIIFGSGKFTKALDHLSIYGLSVWFNTLSLVSLYYFLVIHNKFFIKIASFVVLMKIILILSFHGSLEIMVRNVFISGLVMILSLLSLFLFKKDSAVVAK